MVAIQQTFNLLNVFEIYVHRLSSLLFFIGVIKFSFIMLNCIVCDFLYIPKFVTGIIIHAQG